MVGCSASECTNRSERGFKMLRFPRDSKRKEIWESRVNREGWKSTQCSYLCEAHFDYHQFENKRVDGKRKLKSSGVPTIFPHLQGRRLKKLPKKRRTVSEEEAEVPEETTKQPLGVHDHTYVDDPPEIVVTDDSMIAAENNCSKDVPETRQAVKKKIVKLEETVKSLKSVLRRTKESLRVIQKRTLQEKIGFSRLFGADQMACIRRGSMRGIEWTSVTLEKAQQIRLACGSSGYKFLIQQNFPLPSERTIQRRYKVPVEQPVMPTGPIKDQEQDFVANHGEDRTFEFVNCHSSITV